MATAEEKRNQRGVFRYPGSVVMDDTRYAVVPRQIAPPYTSGPCILIAMEPRDDAGDAVATIHSEPPEA